MSDWTTAIEEAYASSTADVIYHTLELRHPSFTTPVRVVSHETGISATLENDAPQNPGEVVAFEALAFDFHLPDQVDQGQVPEISITLDNVARLLVPYLDQALGGSDPIMLTYRPYLQSDLARPHLNPPLTLVLRSVSVDQSQVSARAGVESVNARRWPRGDYTSEAFPSLVT